MCYIRGMHALAEGHWQEAEKWLLKYVGHSEMPSLHYLAAAEAAEAHGSQVRRHSYLRAAAAHEPRAEVAVGLATAAYHLDYQRAADAVAILTSLRNMQTKHPTVLQR